MRKQGWAVLSVMVAITAGCMAPEAEPEVAVTDTSAAAAGSYTITPVLFVPTDRKITTRHVDAVRNGFNNLINWYKRETGRCRLRFGDLRIVNGKHPAIYYMKEGLADPNDPSPGRIWSEGPSEIAAAIGVNAWQPGQAVAVVGAGLLGWAGAAGNGQSGFAVVGLESLTDTNECSSNWWCTPKVWQGSLIHEVGHLLTLPHSESPSIMKDHSDWENRHLLATAQYPEKSKVAALPFCIDEPSSNLCDNAQGQLCGDPDKGWAVGAICDRNKVRGDGGQGDCTCPAGKVSKYNANLTGTIKYECVTPPPPPPANHCDTAAGQLCGDPDKGWAVGAICDRNKVRGNGGLGDCTCPAGKVSKHNASLPGTIKYECVTPSVPPPPPPAVDKPSATFDQPQANSTVPRGPYTIKCTGRSTKSKVRRVQITLEGAVVGSCASSSDATANATMPCSADVDFAAMSSGATLRVECHAVDVTGLTSDVARIPVVVAAPADPTASVSLMQPSEGHVFNGPGTYEVACDTSHMVTSKARWVRVTLSVNGDAALTRHFDIAAGAQPKSLYRYNFAFGPDLVGKSLKVGCVARDVEGREVYDEHTASVSNAQPPVTCPDGQCSTNVVTQIKRPRSANEQSTTGESTPTLMPVPEEPVFAGEGDVDGNVMAGSCSVAPAPADDVDGALALLCALAGLGILRRRASRVGRVAI